MQVGSSLGVVGVGSLDAFLPRIHPGSSVGTPPASVSLERSLCPGQTGPSEIFPAWVRWCLQGSRTPAHFFL